MTHIEQADELLNQFEQCTRPLFELNQYQTEKEYNKECAIITVEHLIKIAHDDSHFKHTEFTQTHPRYKSYWKLVKEEILKK